MVTGESKFGEDMLLGSRRNVTTSGSNQQRSFLWILS